LLLDLSALMNVKRQLVSGDYVKALAVLKAAVVTWPDYDMLKTNNEKENSTEESSENRYLEFHARQIVFFTSRIGVNVRRSILETRKKRAKTRKILSTEK
jgi:hypothetical protein